MFFCSFPRNASLLFKRISPFADHLCAIFQNLSSYIRWQRLQLEYQRNVPNLPELFTGIKMSNLLCNVWIYQRHSLSLIYCHNLSGKWGRVTAMTICYSTIKLIVASIQLPLLFYTCIMIQIVIRLSKIIYIFIGVSSFHKVSRDIWRTIQYTLTLFVLCATDNYNMINSVWTCGSGAILICKWHRKNNLISKNCIIASQ